MTDKKPVPVIRLLSIVPLLLALSSGAYTDSQLSIDCLLKAYPGFLTEKDGDNLVLADGRRPVSYTHLHEGTVTSYWNPTDLELDYDDLHYFGNGEFGLPFKFDMIVSITYYIFKSDFYSMDEHKMPRVSAHNDHYFEAESEIDVRVEGLVKLTIDTDLWKDITDEAIEKYLEASIDSIDKVSVIE